MKDKSQSPEILTARQELYSIHSEVKKDRVILSPDQIIAGLMGNYQE